MGTDRKSLLFLEDDVAQVVAALQPFQQTARTRANFFMDPSGQVFAQVGEPAIPHETIQALVAASHQATRGIIQIVPQDELVTLTHEGKGASVQVTHGAEGTVLVTVYDAKTTVGSVVFYLRELVDRLNAVVKTVATRETSSVNLGQGFDDAAKGALDDMFDEGEKKS